MFKKIIFGILTSVFAIVAILMEQDMEEKRDVRTVLTTIGSIFLYSWCAMTTLE